MDRAERRRQEREAERRFGCLADLPAKLPGQHRWVAISGYTVTNEQANALINATGEPVFFDETNRFTTTLGCYDCEKEPPEIMPGSTCWGEPEP